MRKNSIFELFARCPAKSVRKQCFFTVFETLCTKFAKNAKKQRFLSFLHDVLQKVWENTVSTPVRVTAAEWYASLSHITTAGAGSSLQTKACLFFSLILTTWLLSRFHELHTYVILQVFKKWKYDFKNTLKLYDLIVSYNLLKNKIMD